MPKVCRYVPNRTTIRRFRPKDIERIVCKMREQGVSEEDIRRAMNRCVSNILDDKARPLIDKVNEEFLKKLEDTIGNLDEAIKTLDDIFGNTDWDLPRWLKALMRQVAKFFPVVGKFLNKLFAGLFALHNAIQHVKELLGAAKSVQEALEASKALADTR